MQPITPVTSDQLLAPGQKPLSKLELFFKNSWVNICNLFSSVGLVGYWPFDEGAGIVAYDHSKYGNDGTLYPTPVPISACDVTTDWTGTDLSIDTSDKKEGIGSLKDDVAEPVIDTTYSTIYDPTGSWDWSAKKHVLCWFKCDRANTAFTRAWLVIKDTSNNYRYWILTFSAGEWTAVKKLLSTGDGQSVTPPDLALINRVYVEFKAADTIPFYKKIDDLRIDDRPQWVDGKVGKALDFDGGNDLVEVFHNGDINSSSVTVSAWINVVDTDDFQSIVQNCVGKTSTRQWAFLVNSAMRLCVYTYNGTDWTSRLTSSIALSESTWHHVVLVIDHVNAVIKFYIDGIERGSVAETGTLGYSPTYLAIGSRWGDVESLDGIIDEVHIYNRALTEGEIKALFELKGKNYVEGVSVSLGGASMTPNPVGGAWNAMLSNENSIFHPKHPTSAYKGYCVTGRKARISIGATYGGIDYYWQRLIGFMDEPSFEAPSYKVSISGADYMKMLMDTELRKPDNYWGSSVTESAKSSEETLGAEMYDEKDAMDIDDNLPNVTPWNMLYRATIASVAPGGAPSTNVGRIMKDAADGINFGYAEDNNVGTVKQGKEYKVVFQYKRNAATAGQLSVGIYKTATYWTGTTAKVVGDTVEPTVGKENNCFYLCTVAGNTGGAEPAWPIIENGGIVDGTVTWATKYMAGKKMGASAGLTAVAWTEEVFYFTATESCAVKMRLAVSGAGMVATEFDVDVFSIKEVTGFSNSGYNLPDECTGPYYATLDGVPFYYRDEGKGWWYDSVLNIFHIENGRKLSGGESLIIYYFTQQIPENIVADLLVAGGLYLNQAAALAAMDYTATGITIDKIWFEAGSTCLNAIKKLCERCDYRFFFNYDGKPVFKPKPAPGATSFTFTEQKHIASAVSYQCRDEIKNRIVIEGLKQAQLVSPQESMPSDLTGEANDPASISTYDERTLTITNHLFQTQASIDAMCATLLAEYKDPKWYTDIVVPYNPAPIELGDMIGWKERLDPNLELTRTGIIRDIKIDKFNTIYKCEIV